MREWIKGKLKWLAGAAVIIGVFLAVMYQRGTREAVDAARREREGSTVGPLSVEPYGYADAAESTGVAEVYFRTVAEIESRQDQSRVNRATGAAGLYQFLPSTWRQYQRRLNLPSFPGDEEAQHMAMAAFTQDNRRYVERRMGRSLVNWELYLAHNQGMGGATKLLRAPGADLARNHVGASAVRLNFGRGNPNLTVREFLNEAREYYEQGQEDAISKWLSRGD